MSETLNPRLNRLLLQDRRRRGRVERDGLVEVLCPGCGAFLAAVLPSAEAWCPWCSLWASADDAPMPGRLGDG
jgi:hypothetical protein